MKTNGYCRKACLLLISVIVLVYLASGCRQQPQFTSYELVTKDGRVLAHTEVMPTPGDQYWDAASDTWYTVVDVQGATGVMLPEPEARPLLRAQQMRRAGIWLLSAVLLLLVFRRLRRRRIS